MDPISALRLANPALQSPAMLKEAAPAQGAPSAMELEGLSPQGGAQAVEPGRGFDGVLKDFVSQVNDKQNAAGAAVNGLLTGQEVPLHQAVIAMEEASVSFQLMVEVRNKLLESYQELMRMQV